MSKAIISSHALKVSHDWGRIMQAVPAIAEAPLYIDDTAAINVTEIRSKCRKRTTRFVKNKRFDCFIPSI